MTKKIRYTREELDQVWNAYNESLNALETFERQEDTKKKAMIESLRDSVSRLVAAGSIPIPQKHIASYVYGQLHERGIKYSRGHFYDLFSEDQKGNYSKSSVGNNNNSSHKHEWEKIVSSTTYGTWETCVPCGANRINGMLQVSAPAPDEYDQVEEDRGPGRTPASKDSEATNPKGIEFEIIDNLIRISQNNARGLKLIRRKANIPRNTGLHHMELVTAERDERLQKAAAKAKCRMDAIRAELLGMDSNGNNSLQDLLRRTANIITKQVQAMRYLDDRASLMRYEKIMARLAVAIGYDRNEIARFLGITTKHMKLNILQMGGGGSSRRSLLNDIEWFGRCPNPDCGIVLKDFFEDRIRDWEAGRTTAHDSYDPEPLIASGYQAQVVQLLERIRKLEDAA